MRSLFLSSILGAVAFAGVACGGGDAAPDSGGGSNVVDGCTGHAVCGTGPALADPEGGNLIFEYIYFDTELQAAFGLPTGVSTVNRVMAYFMNAQSPQDNPLPAPGKCNNLATTMGWPLWVGSPHTDLDVGTLTISGKNAAGTAVSTVVPKQPAGTDSIGRPHDTFYQIITPNADSVIAPDQAFTVSISGSGSVPATTFAAGGPSNDTAGIFLANTFTVSNPGIEDNGPLIGGTDFPVHWNPVTSANLPANDTVLGIVWLVDTNGSPTHMCVTEHSTGTFTIPGATINEYKAVATARGTATTKVILLRNAIVHQIARLPNADTANQRRFDMLGVMCWAQLMDVQ